MPLSGNNCKKLPISDTVNGSTGHEEIANMWRSHYQNLYTSVKSCKHKKNLFDNLNNVSVDCVLSSSTEVSQAIASLDNGKACGLDTIFSENLKYGGSMISVL